MSDGSIVQSGVENVFIVAESEGSGETAGTFNEVIIEAAQGSFVPSLDRSDVNIVGAVLVVEVKTANSDDYVYLTKAGIIEQVIVTSEKDNTDTTTASATFGTDESLSDASAKAANEIANIVKRGENGRPLKDDETEMSIEEVAAISSVDEITISEPKATFEDLAKSQGDDAVFAGGTGTKGNPYLIANDNQWKNLCNMCKEDSSYAATKGKYFKLLSDVDVTKIDSDILNIAYFAGTLDFDNHEVSGLDLTNTAQSYACGIFSLVAYDVTIKNLILTTKALEEYTLCIVGNTDSNYRPQTNIVIENAVVYGNAAGFTGNNSSPFISYAWANTVTLRNCKNYANMNTAAYVAPFVGSYRSTSPATITFDGCDNYGTIISTNSGASLLVANPTNRGGEEVDINFIVNNCHNYGLISGKLDATLLMPLGDDGQPYSPISYQRVYVNNVEVNEPSFNKAQKIIAMNEALYSGVSGNSVSKIVAGSLQTNDNKFVLNETNGATSYALMFSFAAANRNGGGAGYTLEFNSDLPSDIMIGSWITKSEAEQSGKAIITHNQYETTYYTCDGSYVFYEEGATFQHNDRHVFVSFVAYDEIGNVLSIYTYQY